MSEAAPAAAHADRGFLSILADVFFAPGDAFREVASRPRWEAPLLLAIALGLAFSAVWISKADPVAFMKTQMEESGGMERIPPEKRAEVLQGQAKWFQAFAWVGPLFFAPIMYAALAGLFLFVYRFFYGAEATFAQSLAVVCWCFAAFGLALNPLILLVMALKDEWSVDPQSVVQASAAALLDKATTSKPLYALAASLDLFSFWLIALLSIGFGAVIRKPAPSAAWGIVILWAVYVAGKCALAALF
jgi:Yip1-like protein